MSEHEAQCRTNFPIQMFCLSFQTKVGNVSLEVRTPFISILLPSSL